MDGYHSHHSIQSAKSHRRTAKVAIAHDAAKGQGDNYHGPVRPKRQHNLLVGRRGGASNDGEWRR